jgi:hypothetical protein
VAIPLGRGVQLVAAPEVALGLRAWNVRPGRISEKLRERDLEHHVRHRIADDPGLAEAKLYDLVRILCAIAAAARMILGEHRHVTQVVALASKGLAEHHDVAPAPRIAAGEDLDWVVRGLGALGIQSRVRPMRELADALQGIAGTPPGDDD